MQPSLDGGGGGGGEGAPGRRGSGLAVAASNGRGSAGNGHGVHHGEERVPHLHKDASESSAEGAGRNGGPRGVKRTHEELSNCDCDSVYIPLSKRINGLNIERQREAATDSAQQQQQQQQQQSSFQDVYKYPTSAPYYSANHMLYHLHMQRLERMQQQQQFMLLQQQQQQQHSHSRPPM